MNELKTHRSLSGLPPEPASLSGSGLVMIETDRSKTHFTPQPEEPQHLGRPRRERPKSLPQDEELQQVETRK